MRATLATWRGFVDKTARGGFRILTVAAVALLPAMAAGLYMRARPILARQSLSRLLFSTDWRPGAGRFGMGAFLAGTVSVAGVSILLSAPLALLAAIYLAEYASRRVRAAVLPLVDLLAGIPSVIYGVWGILIVVPGVRSLARLCGTDSSGYSLLAGAAVLAVMVTPFILHLTREVLVAVPREMREAALALGATRWQTLRHVVLRRARRGIGAAVLLGLSRALGETIAVLMVVGNVAQVPRSLFDPIYPLPALLANSYGEMMSVPLYDSALLTAALALMAAVAAIHLLARAAMRLLEK